MYQLPFFSLRWINVVVPSESTCTCKLNSSLMMSLGAGAIQVSGGPQASSREEVSMATLEAGTTLQQPLTDTVTLKNFSGDTYL